MWKRADPSNSAGEAMAIALRPLRYEVEGNLIRVYAT
jgi:hypothetical protein